MNRSWSLFLIIFLFSCKSFVADGNKFHHQKLMMKFPQVINEFKRFEILKYNSSGTDVSGGYNFKDQNGSIVATVYVYPAPKLTSFDSPQDVIDQARKRLTNDHFTYVKKSLEQKHPTYVLVYEKETFENFRGKIHYCKIAKYEDKAAKPLINSSGNKTNSIAEVCSVDEWLIKFRITYQSNKEIEKINHFKSTFFSVNSLQPL